MGLCLPCAAGRGRGLTKSWRPRCGVTWRTDGSALECFLPGVPVGYRAIQRSRFDLCLPTQVDCHIMGWKGKLKFSSLSISSMLF